MVMEKPVSEFIELVDLVCATSGNKCEDGIIGGGTSCANNQPAACGYSAAFGNSTT